jgi:hypothetical protein
MKTLVKLFKEAKMDKVLKDIMELSSGTIGSITGFRKYSDIEQVRNDFIMWSQERRNQGFTSWQQAWGAFKDGYDVSKKKFL